MTKFLCKTNGVYSIANCEGSVPFNALFELPKDIGDDAEILNIDEQSQVAVIDPVKQQAKAQAQAQAVVDQAQKEQARKVKLTALANLKGKSLSANDIKALCETLVALLNDDGSSLAQELLRLQTQMK